MAKKRRAVTAEEIQARIERRRALLEADMRRLAIRKSERLRDLRARLSAARRERDALAKSVPQLEAKAKAIAAAVTQALARQAAIGGEIAELEAALVEEERRATAVEVESV